ncbi:MmgE/PrpD family protein [Halorubellus sp. JP-L1]|uniref:MmgE/PrpD family protein n=1 Tax=Halorubellus sp. JP-L1 TaxID=2715753 RepID=UPI00140D77B3|nr:MmgE/PrpD family protein [Halorubellus sp. JP-L1]NHN42848.1 MmgE/PrpD family protein [Halorubellus sp. JP-L1]
MTATADLPVWEQQTYEFLEEPVPDDVLDRGALVVADVLAAATAGANLADVNEVANGADFADGTATVLGTDRSAAPGQAALANTSAAIVQEIEEGHNTGGHVGASIVGGGFALAEHADADGEAFVEAAVKAYEICTRLERGIFAMKDRMNDALPWLVRNPHSTWTTVGPALTGALCMDLDDDQLRNAFRIAANLAVVSMHDAYEEGPTSRSFTAGFSAQAGVDAALTAAAGLQGSKAAMGEVYGPLDDLTDGGFDRWFRTLGDHWNVRESYFKFTPSCRYTHPPLGALQEIVDDVDVDAVESIDVYTYRNACDLDYHDVSTYTSAKFSIPFVLARYLASGDLWLEDFHGDALSDPDTLALAERVHLHHDPTYEQTFPEHWSARVEVTHDDGRTVDAECVDPPGDFRRAPDEADLHALFGDLFEHGVDDPDVALEAVLDIRNRSVRDVGTALRP